MTKKSKNKTPKTSKVNQLALDTRSFWERNEASNGILLNETIKKYAISIFRGILLFGMCFMILQPLLNKIALSFMAEKDLYDTTIILIPKNFSLNNWRVAADMLRSGCDDGEALLRGLPPRHGASEENPGQLQGGGG